ncbi:MAG: hypothetical protein M1815_001215 [Lichina confinis]|nr:MAG: hypothetical protein M1815_001215 [Lichina confinis]
MPLGIERINARKKQPNEQIVFIKPLEGPDKALAQDFLERIAAICNPIMKANHLPVMSLEEHEPNLEFVGRNFNAGEVIQLVLKAPFTGEWLPFRHVQMVMMHELAHIKHMNHSQAFWKVRDQYARELKALWAKDYTGEGFWSRGQTLLSGQYTTDVMPQTEAMPRSLCGGTYRTSARKRKRKTKTAPNTLSYAERKERRVVKKFGLNGVAVGSDEQGRLKLENRKTSQAKPRVAQSVRGRELRAAAALARFDQQKQLNPPPQMKNDDTSDGDSASDLGEDASGHNIGIVDDKGRVMVKVCESEDGPEDSEGLQREMEELHLLNTNAPNRYAQAKSDSTNFTAIKRE